MLKIASLTASSLIIASTLYVGPVAAAVSGDREVVVGSQTIVSADGCGWRRHWSRRFGRCVWNW